MTVSRMQLLIDKHLTDCFESIVSHEKELILWSKAVKKAADIEMVTAAITRDAPPRSFDPSKLYHLTDLNNVWKQVAAAADLSSMITPLLDCYKKNAAAYPSPTISYQYSKVVANTAEHILNVIVGEKVLTEEDQNRIRLTLNEANLEISTLEAKRGRYTFHYVPEEKEHASPTFQH